MSATKTAEEFFQQQNGGKDSRTSMLHDETFTAIYVVHMAELYAAQQTEELRKEVERLRSDLQKEVRLTTDLHNDLTATRDLLDRMAEFLKSDKVYNIDAADLLTEYEKIKKP